MASPKEKLGKAAFAMFRPGKYMQAQADQKAADKQVENAERLRQEGMDLTQQLNWEPDYVSDLMAPYQRTQSPVARSFLESLLTGANPSMVSSTRHGADRLRAGAQAGFDEQTGGWDSLLARQREIESQTPWAPKKFDAPAVLKLPQPQAPEPPGAPTFTAEDSAALAQYGIRLGPDGTPQVGGKSLPAGMHGFGTTTLSPDGYKRLAAAIQAGDMGLAERIYSGRA